MAASVYPEMSAISFEKNMAHPSIRTHDPLEVFNSAVPSRQQWRQLQVLDYITGLIYINYLQLGAVQGCFTHSQNYCMSLLSTTALINLRIFSVMLTCVLSPELCPCKQLTQCGLLSTNSEGGIPISFHMTETHVENIRAAIDMVMSNPSAENVGALFNLMMDLATTNISTSSIDDGQTVQQKNVLLPVSKFIQPHLEISQQHNIKTDKVRTLIPSFMSFPLHHPIVPYSHFQWPVYPKLLHRPDFV
jgi:hypothetical protein